MKNQLVSIIIPTYNGVENICRAVDSALNQTYKNIEIIIVDDNGSGSENQILTQKAFEKYKNNPNVIYIPHKKNINGSAARNTGIRASKGEYIAFLDDDDEYHENAIESHICVWQNLSDDYGITYCGAKYICSNQYTETYIPQYEGDILFDFLTGKIRIGSSLIMVSRDAINYVKEFDESFKRHQDWEFIARILNKYKVQKINNIGVNKFQIGRTVAKTPKIFEKNRLHYLNKMSNIIAKFNKQQQKEIYNHHYYIIGKEYFKAYCFGKSVKYAFKTSNPIYSIIKYFTDGIKYIKKRA